MAFPAEHGGVEGGEKVAGIRELSAFAAGRGDEEVGDRHVEEDGEQVQLVGVEAPPALAVEAAFHGRDRRLGENEDQLGNRSLTEGQKAMIPSVVTSGRPVELIVGLAGSGKTTAVDAARQAFEQAGYRVVGTSISGQAARTLGAEAGIGESHTIASLLWRLDHGLAHLDSRTVVVCDEAGMTDDPSMLRLLAATETAGSKRMIVGDHRQLGAVGPGGSLGALVDRHTGSVHALRENVRQADPEERTMLAHLSAGSVERAVNWYADNGRIDTAPDREQALDQTVAAWAKDVADGKQATMMAWRRANVAALNAQAQQAMRQAGRLTGPDLQVAGNLYQAGDRIVTLAPSTHGQLVTSQRGQVTAVDRDGGRLTVRMDDGRTQSTLRPGPLGRLGHRRPVKAQTSTRRIETRYSQTQTTRSSPVHPGTTAAGVRSNVALTMRPHRGTSRLAGRRAPPHRASANWLPDPTRSRYIRVRRRDRQAEGPPNANHRPRYTTEENLNAGHRGLDKSDGCYRSSELFTDREKVVLDYAVAVMRTPVEVTDELFDRVKDHFTEEQIVEITALLALANFDRFNAAFGIDSAGFSNGVVCVPPDRAAASEAR